MYNVAVSGFGAAQLPETIAKQAAEEKEYMRTHTCPAGHVFVKQYWAGGASMISCVPEAKVKPGECIPIGGKGTSVTQKCSCPSTHPMLVAKWDVAFQPFGGAKQYGWVNKFCMTKSDVDPAVFAKFPKPIEKVVTAPPPAPLRPVPENGAVVPTPVVPLRKEEDVVAAARKKLPLWAWIAIFSGGGVVLGGALVGIGVAVARRK